jgi:hypothetical protein
MNRDEQPRNTRNTRKGQGASGKIRAQTAEARRLVLRLLSVCPPSVRSVPRACPCRPCGVVSPAPVFSPAPCSLSLNVTHSGGMLRILTHSGGMWRILTYPAPRIPADSGGFPWIPVDSHHPPSTITHQPEMAMNRDNQPRNTRSTRKGAGKIRAQAAEARRLVLWLLSVCPPSVSSVPSVVKFPLPPALAPLINGDPWR